MTAATETPADARRSLLAGAGLAALSRLGAIVEIVSQALFIWLFGLAPFGLYVSLWAAIVLASTVVDLATTAGLQRLVPQLDDEAARGAIKIAVVGTVGASLVVAIVAALNAEVVAMQFSAPSGHRDFLPTAIRIFAWALPLWMFIEIATSAVRARQGFGQEIRIRVFWEQIARMAFAVAFYAGGLTDLGLIAAHVASLAFAALMCLRLLHHRFGLRSLCAAPVNAALVRQVYLTSAALFPSNLIRRVLIHGPALVLNILLPGRQGAVAAALFDVARRIATIPYFVRQSFEYVLAPLSSASVRQGDAQVMELYCLATRVIAALVFPLSAFLIFAAPDLLSIYRPEVLVGLPILIILVAGRTADAIAGPAQTIVEMTRHRGLPLLNSLMGFGLWASASAVLVPSRGVEGMAIAVAAATTVSAWAAVVELRPWRDGTSVRSILTVACIAGLGSAVMFGITDTLGGPARFALLVAAWLLTTLLSLRLGLTFEERTLFGGFAKPLRLS